MKKHKHNAGKGQFSIIAALLVAIVLVTAVTVTYSLIRNNPLETRPQVLGTVDKMNLGIDHILEFVVGYYGSILQVTGNTTYAKGLATEYLQESLENLAFLNPSWSPTIEIESSKLSISWFNRTSSSKGSLSAVYSLNSLGISGVRYSTSAELKVTANPSNTTSVTIRVTRDGEKPYADLKKDNFFFYNYSYADSTWTLNNNGLTINSITSEDTYSEYNITAPIGVDTSSYILQVVDTRGIMVSASTFSFYTYTFTWNDSLYSSLCQDTMVAELLQNGSIRWLGQEAHMTTTGKPVPPIPVRAFHVNQTINGVNREVPFQIEDWGSSYKVPAGLTSNASIFGSRQMLVLLLNHNVTNTILWWDGRDIANQTSYAYTNQYFTGDDIDSNKLTNGLLTLTLTSGFTVTSSVVGSSVTSSASFLRINSESPIYGAEPAYVIHHGIVRDIIQQEAEWSSGISGCPNVYSQIVLSFPANATYYSYVSRCIFVDSLQNRTITDLSAIQLTVSNGQPLTEDGTAGGYPIASSESGFFYNESKSSGVHHWSQFVSEDSGAGIMFVDKANQKLYVFDDISGEKTGAINVIGSNRVIEVNPVELASVTFQHSLDLSLYGAVVSFDGTDPIYDDSSKSGLWVMVEFPPTVAVS